jgi:ribosomal protein L13E
MLVTNERMSTIRRLAARKGMNSKIVKKPSVVVRQPYIMVEVVYKGQRGHGFSKCSPRDTFDEDIGFSIAVSRALSDVKDAQW